MLPGHQLSGKVAASLQSPACVRKPVTASMSVSLHQSNALGKHCQEDQPVLKMLLFDQQHGDYLPVLFLLTAAYKNRVFETGI